MKKNTLYFISIFLLSFLQFRTFLTTYFFQDDFFLLAISKAQSLQDIAKFFIPRSDVQFYRPLAVEVLFFLLRILFGRDPIFFHLFIFITFCLVLVLVYLFSGIFLTNKSIRYVATVLFATSSLHYNSLNWLSNSSYILLTFFYIAALYVYIKKKNILFLCFLFTLGLLTNELMITFPLACISYSFIVNNRKISPVITKIATMVLIAGAYIVFRFILFKPHVGDYQYVFDKSILSSYRWYILFFLNWPEIIKDNMIAFYKLRPEFVHAFTKETLVLIINSYVVGICLPIIPLFIIIKEKWSKLFLNRKAKEILFLFIFFLLSLLPIIFIPQHVSPQHGTITLIAWIFLLLIPLDFIYQKKRIVQITLLIVVTMSWVYSSGVSINMYNQTHWIRRRSNIAKHYLAMIDKRRNEILPNSQIIIGSNDIDTQVALFYDKGIKEFLNMEDVKIIFSNDKKYREKLIIINSK